MKLTKNQREYFKQLVLESQLKRLSPTEATQWIHQKLGIQLSISHYEHVKAQMRREVGKRLEFLMKDRYAYVAQYFERIDELKQIQKDLQELIRSHPNNPHLQKNCYSELHSLTLSINSLYELLPELMEIQLQQSEGYAPNKIPTSQPEEDTDPEAQF
jgi:hypothetical protein